MNFRLINSKDKIWNAIVIILLCITSSCSDKVPEEFVNRKIELGHDLGLFEIDLPSEFDTTFTRSFTSDYLCGRKTGYIFIDKEYYYPLEITLFRGLSDSDSLYSFMLKHPIKPECKDTTLKVNSELMNQVKQNAHAVNPTAEMDILEIRKIDDHKFLVKAYTRDLKGRTISNVSATTFLNGYAIDLSWHCAAQNCRGFIERMNKSLNTLRFHENPPL